MTLQELADRLGTTAQSVQRLETGKTKVNLDWLDRFATALDVPMRELIGPQEGDAVRLLGTMGAEGVVASPSPARATFQIAVPAREPVAVRLSETVGPYREGSILIADRGTRADLDRADGRSCLVALETGEILLRRVVVRSKKLVTLLAHGGKGEVLHDVSFRWLGPVVMVIAYV